LGVIEREGLPSDAYEKAEQVFWFYVAISVGIIWNHRQGRMKMKS
jgi:hypothetical protein